MIAADTFRRVIAGFTALLSSMTHAAAMHRPSVAAICSTILVLAGCAGSASSTRESPTDPMPKHDSAYPIPGEVVDTDAADAETLSLTTARARLLHEVDRWNGTRYRHGGTGSSGFDCSGFVHRVFRDALNVTLPRATQSQMETGQRVERDELRLADLVFFFTPARSHHVGIYLDNGEFAHASTSSGVMISHIDEDYWRDSYRTARRPVQLAAPAAGDVPGDTVATNRPRRPLELPYPASAAPTDKRVGW